MWPCILIDTYLDSDDIHAMMMMMMHDPVRAMYRRDHCITVHKLIKRVSTIMCVWVTNAWVVQHMLLI